MAWIELIADWYIKIFKVLSAILFLSSLFVIVAGLTQGQTWILLALPALIVLLGNMAVFILMYQHLKSIDSKRL